jgi:hypothetical protein
MNAATKKAMKLFDDMERKAQSLTDPYRTQVETLMAAILNREDVGGGSVFIGDVDDIDDVRHLRKTRGGHHLETAARCAGFVIGIQMAAKGGAR